MFIKFIDIGLLSILFAERGSALLQIVCVNFISADPEYIDFKQSAMFMHPQLSTISIKLHLLKPFPETAKFEVDMIEEPPGDIMINLLNYSTPICDFQNADRYKLPIYIRDLTSPGHCGRKGTFFFKEAGLYGFVIPIFMRSVPYPIVNSNEIVDGNRIILKYDVVLGNENFNILNTISPYRNTNLERPAKRLKYTITRN